MPPVPSLLTELRCGIIANGTGLLSAKDLGKKTGKIGFEKPIKNNLTQPLTKTKRAGTKNR